VRAGLASQACPTTTCMKGGLEMAIDGTVRRAALGGIAASLVIGLAACGSAVAGAGGSAQHAAPKPAATLINPGGPLVPATMLRHPVLCTEIPRLTRLVFIRTGWPLTPKYVHEALPSGFTVRDAATVRQIATTLCSLPPVKAGWMSCPNLGGSRYWGSYRLYFAAPGRPIPTVGIELSGCRVVTGLGPVRSWATSTGLEQELSHGFGGLRAGPPFACPPGAMCPRQTPPAG
jgi:hypothetical protein